MGRTDTSDRTDSGLGAHAPAGVVRPTSKGTMNGAGDAEGTEAALRADAEGRRKLPAATLGGAGAF